MSKSLQNIINIFLSKYEKFSKLNFGNRTDDHEIFVVQNLIKCYDWVLIDCLDKKGKCICCHFQDNGKYLNVEQTAKNIRLLNLKDGCYIIKRPYNKISFVPPPDIYILCVVDNNLVDYLGIECKSSTTNKPTFNDNIPSYFDESRILYLFTNVKLSYTCIFVGELIVSKEFVNLKKEMFNEFDKLLNVYKNKNINTEFSFNLSYRKKCELIGSFAGKYTIITKNSVEFLKKYV